MNPLSANSQDFSGATVYSCNFAMFELGYGKLNLPLVRSGNKAGPDRLLWDEVKWADVKDTLRVKEMVLLLCINFLSVLDEFTPIAGSPRAETLGVWPLLGFTVLKNSYLSKLLAKCMSLLLCLHSSLVLQSLDVLLNLCCQMPEDAFLFP